MQIQVVHQHGVCSSTAQTKVDLSICLTLCYFKCLLVSLLKVSRTKIFKTFFILSGFGLNVILIVSLFKCSQVEDLAKILQDLARSWQDLIKILS